MNLIQVKNNVFHLRTINIAALRRCITIVVNKEIITTKLVDVVNKNNRPIRGEPGKVRCGFIPDEWFTFFHDRTGVTGFYTFCFTTGTYLISKEIYVLEHNYYGGLSMLILCYFVTKRLGPHLASRLDQYIDEYENEFKQNRENIQENYEDMITNENQLQFSMDGQLILLAARRERVALQLEAEYRRRMMEVYKMVKRYLDYHVLYEARKRKYLHENMKEWILKKVNEALTPSFLDKYLNDCIDQLPSLIQKIEN